MKTLPLNEIFSQSYRVTCADMDCYYNLTESAAIAYFQDACAAYMTKCHLAAFDLLPDGLIWVVSDYAIDFVANTPIWLENVRVDVAVTEVTAMRMYFDFKLYTPSGTLFAQGSSSWSVVNLSTVRPVALTDVFTVPNPEDANPALKHKKFIIPKMSGDVAENLYKVTSGDIDFNMHTGNRSYLAMAIHFLDADFVASHSMSAVYIKFNRQSFLGNELTVMNQMTEIDGTSAVISEIRNADGASVCSFITKWRKSTAPQLPVKEIVTRFC